jgi:hypothetical protein
MNTDPDPDLAFKMITDPDPREYFYQNKRGKLVLSIFSLRETVV